MTQGYWQLAATELYDSVQKRIPEDWRLPDELLAKAWVLPKDVDPNTVKPVDTRDIAESSGVMSAKELAITESTDLEALQCKLASREYTSYEVTLGEYCDQ